MYRISCLLVLSLILSVQVQAKNCVSGQWLFDKGASDNVKKISKKLLKDDNVKLNIKNLVLPAFVLSSSDLHMQQDDSGVTIIWSDSDGQSQQRYFSTVGKTKSVSLKSLKDSGNTVVASWEEKALVVETTTPQGLYIAEKFSLENVKGKSQKLLIKTQLANRVGWQLTIDKVYLQTDRDSLACSPETAAE